ncbi:hypothetical protein C8A03DRAFT_33198 [Achaetomium macrosporum]|uniref:Uncharacterized protein n=1 Tax=Achaetomium macrosporum TaxID=79813 RepID=A0AAN7CB20_9PEZI|nr:hypothetical protein C8A03DRAFT_33198 [Achaetomium macrosporum]
MATAPTPLPMVYVRRGDIQDSGARNDEERHQIATTPTIIACLLVTVGPGGTGTPRYKQHQLGTLFRRGLLPLKITTYHP